MDMPQDFIDAINAAVREINPDARTTVRGSMTLGSDFDEWVGVEALTKHGIGPIPPEDVAAFEAKFNERRDELKRQLVASAVEVEKRRLAGTLVNQPPLSGRETMDIRDFIDARVASAGEKD